MLRTSRAPVNVLPSTGARAACVQKGRSARKRYAAPVYATETLEKPAAESRSGAVAGATGTNVLRICPMRFSQPS